MANIGNFQNLGGSSVTKTLAAFAQKLTQIGNNVFDTQSTETIAAQNEADNVEATSSVEVSDISDDSANAKTSEMAELSEADKNKPFRKGMLLDIRV